MWKIFDLHAVCNYQNNKLQKELDDLKRPKPINPAEYCVALFKVETAEDYDKMREAALGCENQEHRVMDRGLIALGCYSTEDEFEVEYFMLYNALFPGTPNQLINMGLEYYGFE